jgi:adenine-specific DNA-methyltransferase
LKNNKNTGSFYTPEFLSRFVINYVAPFFTKKKELFVLEPSTGDGSFVEAINGANFPGISKNINITAVEKIEGELIKAEERLANCNRSGATFQFVHEDFLKFEPVDGRRYHLIAGNPPYIKKTLLSIEDIESCKEIHFSALSKHGSVKNIWSAFLLKCSLLLADDGVLALILPAELLQVSYAAELREFLIEYFERTEIFTFDDLLFECKGQDTVLFIGYKKATEKGQFFTNIPDTHDLETGNFELIKNNVLVATGTKWTHHFLSTEELGLINRLKAKLKPIEYYCDAKPGIVSAANEYFIIDEKTERDFDLTEYSRPIIQKALYINGSVEFTKDHYNKLNAQGKPSKILCFTDKDNQTEYPKGVVDYLSLGEIQEFVKGYKCKQRTNWFVVPNISTVPEAFFFKRSHFYPKLIHNAAKVLVTDSAYKVDLRPNYNVHTLIYSFYNSLTLAVAELTGRYYGGGVLELTPQEFKKLPVPYLELKDFDFTQYAKSFEDKSSITDILHDNDRVILGEVLGLNEREIEQVSDIYHKLINKRFRNNKVIVKSEPLSACN